MTKNKENSTKKEEQKGMGSLDTAKKVATSPAFGRTIAVAKTMATITVATIPAAVFGLSSIALGATMDTIQTRELKSLNKENSLLVKNRVARELQETMLSGPRARLADILAPDLYKPDSSSPKNSQKERYEIPVDKNIQDYTSYGKAMLKNVLSLPKQLIGVYNSPTLIGGGFAINSLRGIRNEAKSQSLREDITLDLKTRINEERSKPDAVGYDNIDELRENTRQQRVQTLALQELIKRGYKNLSDDEIREKFSTCKARVEGTLKVIQQEHSMVETAKSYGRDFLTAHNPFSKYNNLQDFKVKDDKEIRKAYTKAEIPEKSITAQSVLKAEEKEIASIKAKIHKEHKPSERSKNQHNTKKSHSRHR